MKEILSKEEWMRRAAAVYEARGGMTAPEAEENADILYDVQASTGDMEGPEEAANGDIDLWSDDFTTLICGYEDDEDEEPA